MQRGITHWLELVAAIQAMSMLPAVGGDAAQDGGNTVMYIYEMNEQPANADDCDEVAALASMQGIINRDKPILYINNETCQI